MGAGLPNRRGGGGGGGTIPHEGAVPLHQDLSPPIQQNFSPPHGKIGSPLTKFFSLLLKNCTLVIMPHWFVANHALFPSPSDLSPPYKGGACSPHAKIFRGNPAVNNIPPPHYEETKRLSWNTPFSLGRVVSGLKRFSLGLFGLRSLGTLPHSPETHNPCWPYLTSTTTSTNLYLNLSIAQLSPSLSILLQCRLSSQLVSHVLYVLLVFSQVILAYRIIKAYQKNETSLE